MLTFWEWLSQLKLLEQAYYTFDPKQYDNLFDRGVGEADRPEPETPPAGRSLNA